MINLFIFLFLNFSHADTAYQLLSENDYPYVKKVFSVKNLSPIKDQNDIGLCYAFSTARLLENYRCKTLNVSCEDEKNWMSPYYLSHAQTNANRIAEGGWLGAILHNVNKSTYAVKEECAPFSSIVAKGDQDSYNEKMGLKELDKIWQKYKQNKNENECLNQIRSSIKKLETDAEQLRQALLNSKEAEEFRFHAIIPKKCLKDPSEHLQIPKYEIGLYPKKNGKMGMNSFFSQAKKLIQNDTPFSIAFCLEIDCDKPGSASDAHALVVSGYQERCDKKSQCKVFLKLTNSFGRQWQDTHSDGWVDGKNLYEHIKKFSSVNSNIVAMHWVTRPGNDLSVEPAIDQEDLTVSNDRTPAITKIWKCKTADGSYEFNNKGGPGCAPYK